MSFQFFSKLDNKITDGPISQVDPGKAMRGFAENSPDAKLMRLEDRRDKVLARRIYRTAAKSNDLNTMINAYEFLQKASANGGTGAGIAQAGNDLIRPGELAKSRQDQLSARESRLGPVQGLNRDSGAVLGQPGLQRDPGTILGRPDPGLGGSIVTDEAPGTKNQPASTIDSLTEMARERSGANDLLGVSGNPLLNILGGKPAPSAPTQSPSLIESRNPLDFPPGEEPKPTAPEASPKALSDTEQSEKYWDDYMKKDFQDKKAVRDDAYEARRAKTKSVLDLNEKTNSDIAMAKEGLALRANDAGLMSSIKKEKDDKVKDDFRLALGGFTAESEGRFSTEPSDVSYYTGINLSTNPQKSGSKNWDTDPFNTLKASALGKSDVRLDKYISGSLSGQSPKDVFSKNRPDFFAQEKIIKASIKSGYDISKDKELMAIPNFRKRLEEERAKTLPAKGKDGMTTTARKAPTMKLGYDMA